MAIYRTGQASMDADGYITGYGTKWKTALTLIRPGATIVFASNPVAYATISEIVNDTSMRATSTGGAVVPRGDYVILLHDSITVDGLAQDVAETLRYYQGQETMYEQFVEFLKGFDWQRMEQLGEKVYADSKAAEASANAAKASETNANASKNAAAGSATTASQKATEAANSAGAAKTSETNANASKNAAASSATAAANSATTAGQHKDAAAASASAARTSEGNASSSKNAAAASASAAKTSETNAKASETSATASKNAAKTSEDNAAASKNAAASSASAAAGSATSASNSAATAKSEADRAADLARQLDATNLMRKDANLSDVTNKAAARENLQVDRLVQGSTVTTVGKSGGNRLAVNDGGEWGAIDSGNNWIALGVGKGGTGARDAAGARANIESFHQKRTSLGASVNLNSLFGFSKTGYYFNSMNANATAANNYPEAFAGVLLVTSSQANGVEQTRQTYFPYDKPEIFYVRHYNKSGSSWVWSGWVKHISAFRYGVGAIGSLRNNVTSAACQFISDNDGSTSWAPANGAGFQASYADNRMFQLWITSTGDLYTRYNDSTDPKAAKTSKAWKQFPRLDSQPYFSTVVGATGTDGKKVSIGVGGADVFLRNEKNQKYLQLKDDGRLTYADREIMWRGIAYAGDYEVTMGNNFRVITGGGGLQIKGNDGAKGRALYLSGVNGDGSRAWYLGKGGAGAGVEFYNDGGGGTSFQLASDGAAVVRTKDYGMGFWVDAAKMVVRRSNGRALSIENLSTASQNGTIVHWGNVDRPSVMEFKVDSGYFFYSQLNTDKSRIMHVNGTVKCTSLIQTSDRDLKDNIEVIQDATASLRKMNGYTYTMKEDGMPYAGVIAQEVMEALPEAINGVSKYVDIPGVNKDGSQLQGEERYLGVDYSAVTGLLVQVCRESDDRITKLEQENEALKSELESLKSGLESLKSAVASLQSAVSQ